MKGTLKNVVEKSGYLDDKIKSYTKYVHGCVAATASNHKKKFVFPFTSQYFHEQTLRRENRECRFGSFQYAGDKLFEKGVLVELVGVPASQRNKVSITISSDEVGVFELQGKFLGVNVGEMELRLDSLLQKQFDNVQVITLFGVEKFNVNLLIHFLNKLFNS